MKKFMIIHAHNANRGDEAAVHAMVDELIALYPDCKITISNQGNTPYPSMPKQVNQIKRFPIQHSRFQQAEFMLDIATCGKVVISQNAKEFLTAAREADLVIHAPGGPSIGDVYYRGELLYLLHFELMRKMHKPYMFYAPSMGPFNTEKRNKLRKKVLLGAERIILRDPISYQYVKEFIPEAKVELALDSALQHDIDLEENKTKLSAYTKLKHFLDSHERCIGVTITDLLWHPTHGKNSAIAPNITKTFNAFLNDVTAQNIGVVFIPQLYGEQNDSRLMQQFAKNDRDYFVVEDNDDRYDSYFQQYLIGQLYAVVGMRYHSNIFSSKMGTPFVSVSYEQKMQGFMQKVGLSEYCIPIADLSYEMLKSKFELLEENYDTYKNRLNELHAYMKAEAYKTTLAVKEIVDTLQ